MKQIDDRAGEPIAAQFLLMRPCPFIRRHRFAALESVNISAYHMPTPRTPRIRAHRQPSKLSFISHPSFHRRCNTVYTLIIDPITSRFTSIVPDRSADDAADQATNDGTNGCERPRDSGYSPAFVHQNSLPFVCFSYASWSMFPFSSRSPCRLAYCQSA